MARSNSILNCVHTFMNITQIKNVGVYLFLKNQFYLQVVAKPAVRVTAGPSAHTSVKMELDEQVSQKRKRDDDDYDT